MNDRGIQVLEQYDLDVKRVIKGRGAMLAECSEDITGCWNIREVLQD